MAIAQRLLGSGAAALLATNIIGDFQSGVTATGTTITDAYDIIAVNTEFTTVASGTGAQLISGNPGDSQFVYNGGSNALLVYPPSSTETIQSGSAGAGFSVAANKSAMFLKRSATAWAANLSA